MIRRLITKEVMMKAVIGMVVFMCLFVFKIATAGEPGILVPEAVVSRHAAAGGKWTALYREAGEYRLSPSRIDVEEMGSGAVGDTCVRVLPVEPMEVLLYIKGSLLDGNRELTSLTSGKELPLMPGQKLVLPADSDYRGTKVGFLPEYRTAEDSKQIRDFSVKMYFGKNVYAVDFEDAPIDQFSMPGLLWAGDMDGDREIDMLLKFPSGKNSRYSLYLSARQEIYRCSEMECGGED